MFRDFVTAGSDCSFDGDFACWRQRLTWGTYDVCQARKPSARSPGQWRREAGMESTIAYKEMERFAHACAMITIPLLRRPAPPIVERPPPSPGATDTALLLQSR